MLSSPIDFTSDGHVHTKLCNHAKGEMEEYVQAAIAKGLSEIIFLEHLEEGIVSPWITWLDDRDFDYYFEEGNRLKQKYQDQIRVKLGVEVGYNHAACERIKERLARRSWDKISLSYHFFPVEGEAHINLLSRNPEHSVRMRAYGPGRIAREYLETLTQAVDIIDAHALSHLDAGLRHILEINFARDYMPEVIKLLAAVQRKGMALELNTSGYGYVGDTFPAQPIIKKAMEMGIPFVVGSDAHAPEDVGRKFDTLASSLQAIA